MKNTETLISKIKSGQAEVSQAMAEMYEDVTLQKSAVYWYRRYPSIHHSTSWEDLFSEGILRFVRNVLEAEQKNSKPIQNANAFFHIICRNVAMEWHRDAEKPEPYLPQSSSLERFMELVKPYIDALAPQCRFLLTLLYYHQPPVLAKNRKVIAAELEKNGYKVSEDSVPAVITRCKSKLKEKIHANLDDFEDFHTNHNELP